MAEGLARQMFGDKAQVQSAGAFPSHVHPCAIQVMKEIGIDVSRQESKRLSAFLGQNFDQIITVCDRARQDCPFSPGTEPIHWSFDDPAAPNGDELTSFRRVRDEILQRIRVFLSADRIAV